MKRNPPIVLAFSGHDPSGGAGIQADIEAIASQGCHACSVITALTRQDTRNIQKVIPQPTAEITAQARLLLNDMPIQAIKIGLLGNAAIASALYGILKDYPQIPLVLDPILAAGGGAELADGSLIEAIKTLLVPLTTVLTPNSLEARRLVPETGDLDRCGVDLLALGCGFVLITGAHEDNPKVDNTLYSRAGSRTFHWKRLSHSYHGSGCTLAASIAAKLALGLDPVQAIQEAQEYTWQALHAGFLPGKGQYVPNRFFWTKK